MTTIMRLPTRVVRLDDMSPAAYNPRVRLVAGTERYDALRDSLLRFGESGGIVWNERTGNIVGGHQRYYILRDAGIEMWEVSVGDYSEAEERAFNIALNKQGSEWDIELLQASYAQIDAELRRYTGFEDADIQQLMRVSEVSAPDSFLDSIANEGSNSALGVGGAELKDDHPHRTGPQYFPYQLVFDSDQKDVFFRAVSKAKADMELDSSMEAITAICMEFLGE